MSGDQIHTQAIIDFYNGHEPDDIKSKAAGRPIFNDVEMIRIRWAGNTKSELHAPANDRSDRPVINPMDRSRSWPKWKDHPDFRAAYDAFKAGQSVALNGTPISELPFLTEARRAELRAVNILSVEQLANLDNSALKKFGMDMAELKRQAGDFLERAAGAAVDARHAAQRKEMQDQIDELKAMLTNPAKAPAPAPKPVAAPAMNQPTASNSPFESWDDDGLRLWLTERNGEAPHNRCGHAKLVAMADEVAARLQAEVDGSRVAA